MTLQEWLRVAHADAQRRGLPDLKPLLEALAQATAALREAEFEREDDDAGGVTTSGDPHD
ncbi:MAG: hypothetical protein HY654_10150 [Acidobacteria bacterium]|nr:hypothetical protein [Acidobacteriota bacterium]